MKKLIIATLFLLACSTLAADTTIAVNTLLIDLGKRYKMTPQAVETATSSVNQQMQQAGVNEPLLTTLKYMNAIGTPPQLEKLKKPAAVYGMLLAVYANDRKKDIADWLACDNIKHTLRETGLKGIAQTYKRLPAQAQIATKPTYRQVGAIERNHFGVSKRYSARIVVPNGLSKKQLTEMLTKAAKTVALEYRADAAKVFAYRATDVDIKQSAWTVGHAVYAPNGKWADATENAPKKVVVQLGTIYFQPENADTLKAGDKANLTTETGTPINVSRTRGVWSSDHSIAQVPSGTPATILERYEKAASPDYLLVHYRIKTTYQEKEIEGWVFEEDLLK